MGRREALPPSTPAPEAKKPEQGKILSRAALLFAVGLGLLKDTPVPELNAEEKVKEAQLEKQAKLFELPPELAVKFPQDKERQVAGKRKLIHVGQLHYNVDVLTPAQQAEAIPYIIQNQKDIEKLILYMKDTYGVDTVFLEGLTLDGGLGQAANLDVLRDWDMAYNISLGKSDFQKIHDLFNALVDNFNADVKEYPRSYRSVGLKGYFLKQRVHGFLEQIEKLRGKIEVPEYITARMQAIREGIDKIEVNQGDNKYLFMSSAEILWVQGIIKLGRCDNREAFNASAALPLPAHDAPADVRAEYIKKIYDLSQKREDTALSAADQWMKGNDFSYSLVVFGDGHDFSANMRVHNETATEGNSCGLITLSSEAAQQYYAAINLTEQILADPKKKI